MATRIVHEDRIRLLTEEDRESSDGRYVLYWMQRSQRAERNDALEHAIRVANRHRRPLLVCVGITSDYPEATGRHLRFMLEGLGETRRALDRRGIPLTARTGPPAEIAADLAGDAAVVVTDRAYQRHLVEWRDELVDAVDCPVVEVEADVVVPVEVVSDRREYAARTFRPKIHQHLDGFLGELRTTPLERALDEAPGSDIDLADVDEALRALGVDQPEDPHVVLRGGTAQAKAHLRSFLDSGLGGYGDRSPDPVDPGVSRLSPYLHFGQISPVFVVSAVRAAGGSSDDVGAFVEELVVRRELATNYVRHEPAYDRYAALPDWARATLDEHRDDEREAVYTARQLEDGRTHDPAWNACMAEMRATGYLHNHLRMYWGKQVMRWTNTPEHAFRTLLELNNRYFLDGRDCSSFANVAWVFGLHDRAFGERAVTGTTRPMTLDGLRRKIDLDAWLGDVRSRLGDAAVDGPGGEAR